MKEIMIVLKGGIELRFVGKYLPNRQTDNWHYYEDYKGVIYHIKKSEMIYVLQYNN